MEAIEVDCPECGAHIKAPARLAGRSGRCPGCKATVRIPDGSDASEAEATDEDATAPLVRARRAHEPEPRVAVPLLAAIGGAVAGAFLWAAITLLTRYEPGYAAWGVGLLVGAGCALPGGRGQGMAATCALLAILAIASGRFLSTYVAMRLDLNEQIDEIATPERFAEIQRVSRAFAKLPEGPTMVQVRDFMVEHGYSTAERAELVPEPEVREFITTTAPDLLVFDERDPTYAQWRDGIGQGVTAELSLVDTVADNTGAMDLLFAFLGITTAYGVVFTATHRDHERKSRIHRHHPRGVGRAKARRSRREA